MSAEKSTVRTSNGQTFKLDRRGRYKLIVMRYRRNKLAMVGMFVFLVLLIAVFSAPLYIDYSDAITPHIVAAFTKPCKEHIFGTDQFGRDLFARVIYGGRISLGAGLATVAISFVGGVVLGGRHHAGYGHRGSSGRRSGQAAGFPGHCSDPRQRTNRSGGYYELPELRVY